MSEKEYKSQARLKISCIFQVFTCFFRVAIYIYIYIIDIYINKYRPHELFICVHTHTHTYIYIYNIFDQLQ